MPVRQNAMVTPHRLRPFLPIGLPILLASTLFKEFSCGAGYFLPAGP